MAHRLSEITDVVWINTAFIGDVVLNSGAMHLLRQKRPDIRQHLITTEAGLAIFAGEGLKSITVFNKDAKNPVSALKSMRNIAKQISRNIATPQTAVTLQVHRSFRSSLLARVLGYPTITYQQTAGAWLSQMKVDRIACFHEVERAALLLTPFGIGREDIIGLKPSFNKNTSKKYEGQNIAIAPGSVWGTKRWPIERFIDLAKTIVRDRPDVRVFFIGGKSDLTNEPSILREFPANTQVNSLIGKTSLVELKSLISGMDLVISNDSSPIHFASAFNIPTVAIFGATTPALGFGPRSTKSKICEVRDLPCRPCSDHGPHTCPLTHFRCMRDLSVEQVYRAVVDLL